MLYALRYLSRWLSASVSVDSDKSFVDDLTASGYCKCWEWALSYDPLRFIPCCSDLCLVGYICTVVFSHRGKTLRGFSRVIKRAQVCIWWECGEHMSDTLQVRFPQCFLLMVIRSQSSLQAPSRSKKEGRKVWLKDHRRFEERSDIWSQTVKECRYIWRYYQGRLWWRKETYYLKLFTSGALIGITPGIIQSNISRRVRTYRGATFQEVVNWSLRVDSPRRLVGTISRFWEREIGGQSMQTTDEDSFKRVFPWDPRGS